jgi:hypothetical protein
MKTALFGHEKWKDGSDEVKLQTIVRQVFILLLSFRCILLMLSFKYSSSSRTNSNNFIGSLQGRTGHWGDLKMLFWKCEALKNAWHFQDIFRENEAFFNYCEGFLKIARLFKYIFSGIEVFFKVLWGFSKIRGLFKTIKEKMRGLYKNYEAFWRHF